MSGEIVSWLTRPSHAVGVVLVSAVLYFKVVMPWRESSPEYVAREQFTRDMLRQRELGRVILSAKEAEREKLSLAALSASSSSSSSSAALSSSSSASS
jgi:hypothetical protein